MPSAPTPSAVAIWLLKPSGEVTRLTPADPRRPMLAPEQIVVPEFDEDPTVEEFRERTYTRFPVVRGDALVAYVYAEREPTAADLARLLAAGG